MPCSGNKFCWGTSTHFWANEANRGHGLIWGSDMASILRVPEVSPPRADYVHVQTGCHFESAPTAVQPQDKGWAHQGEWQELLPMTQMPQHIQCWECGGKHYRAGCPRLPPPRRSRRRRSHGKSENCQYSSGPAPSNPSHSWVLQAMTPREKIRDMTQKLEIRAKALQFQQ